MDAYNWGTANATPIDVYTCHAGANQERTPYSDGTIREAQAPERCLQKDDKTGTLELWDCTGAANQIWRQTTS